jgi:hypothetical protein
MTPCPCCADCGIPIQRHPRSGWWGEKRIDGSWHFCCRATLSGYDSGRRVTSADYHHIQGEPQRHFSADRGKFLA